MIGERIVAEAREWIGTPHHHQQSVKGRGCDCKGLVAGVAREMGRPEGASLFAGMGNYSTVIPTRLLRDGLAALFDQVSEIQAGDVLLLIVGGKPQHLAIATGTGRMIHTYSSGPMAVIEVPMGTAWNRAIDSVWRWREI